ncbi:hypothetical protein B0A52_03147 [Exophiala mesophila]|uniref:Uncharacterized protein n=1 Tax=Exophiala mesophila TaxID=212818 RepID=A0A438NAI9_EXOME|nr:hypothetical protein B0A52_03147 [Exophiala mesophila]
MEVPKDYVPVFIFVIGAPGAGKGTICQTFAQQLDFYHLSLGDTLRKLVKEKPDSSFAQAVKPYITSETLMPNDMLREFFNQHILPEALACRHLGVLIDGFPRAASQISCWTGPAPRLVLFFDCPKELASKRVVDRGRGGASREELAKIFAKRYDQFEKENGRILDHFGYVKSDEGVFYDPLGGILQDPLEAELNKRIVIRVDTSGTAEESWQTLLEELERSTYWTSVEKVFDDLLDRKIEEQKRQMREFDRGSKEKRKKVEQVQAVGVGVGVGAECNSNAGDHDDGCEKNVDGHKNSNDNKIDKDKKMEDGYDGDDDQSEVCEETGDH